jgi:hypothetical protein
MSFERLTKKIHSWLGVLILPWVAAMGFTGLYMNHDDLILSMFPTAHYDATLFDSALLARSTDETAAEEVAARLAPGEDLFLDEAATSFHDRSVFTFEGESSDVMIDRATGFGWVDSRYLTQTFAPDGTRLHSRIRWSRVLSSIHERGWVGNRFGTWLADITACALVLFGLSGLILFAMPRLRRRRNRRARLGQHPPQQAVGR